MKLKHIIECETHTGRYHSRYHKCVACCAAAVRQAREQDAAKKASAAQNDEQHPPASPARAKKTKGAKKPRRQWDRRTRRSGQAREAERGACPALGDVESTDKRTLMRSGSRKPKTRL